MEKSQFNSITRLGRGNPMESSRECGKTSARCLLDPFTSSIFLLVSKQMIARHGERLVVGGHGERRGATGQLASEGAGC